MGDARLRLEADMCWIRIPKEQRLHFQRNAIERRLRQLGQNVEQEPEHGTGEPEGGFLYAGMRPWKERCGFVDRKKELAEPSQTPLASASSTRTCVLRPWDASLSRLKGALKAPMAWSFGPRESMSAGRGIAPQFSQWADPRSECGHKALGPDFSVLLIAGELAYSCFTSDTARWDRDSIRLLQRSVCQPRSS